jgi:uncharacterized protein involved in exopolysaccharide biosynthesis
MSSENKEQVIDLKSYWGVIMRRKALIILPLLIVPLVAFAITYLLKPSFASTVTILINETSLLPNSVEQDVANAGRTRGYEMPSREELQTSYYNQITSNKYLHRLIANQNIPISAQLRARASAVKANYPQVSEDELTVNLLADNLRTQVSVNLRANNLIEIKFSSSNPVTAQKMAGNLADIFMEENLASELAGVRSNISFSDEQLAFYQEKLKSAQDKMKEFRQGLVYASMGHDTTSTNLREMASAGEALDLDVSRLQDRRANIRTDLNVRGVDVAGMTLPDELLSEKVRLLSGASRLSVLLSSYSWRDPKVMNLNEESRSLSNQISNDITTYINKEYADKPQDERDHIAEYLFDGVSIDFDSAKLAILNKNIGQAKAALSQDPATDVTMQRLQSEIDSYKKFYDLFVSHSQNAAIDQSAKKVEAEAKYTIIKPATLPLAPESPKRLRIFAMALALALCIGFGSIIMVELLDSSFKNIEDIADYLKLPVIGTIPRIELPYVGSKKKRIPIIVGVGLCVILIIFIAFMRLTKKG